MERPTPLTRPVSRPGARRRPAPRPEIVLIGASTGGPQALVALIDGLAAALPRVAICVTLHLPSDLMHVVADHVARTCRVATAVIGANERLEAGLVHFAPGDRHLTFERRGGRVAAVLMPLPVGDVSSSAVDAMFISGAACYGAGALGVVLSGMGRDGLAGARAIVDLAAAVLEPAAMAREIVARTALVGRFA